MGRKNLFEAGLDEFNAIAAMQPIDNELIFGVIAGLEQNGASMIGEGRLKAVRYAEAMHGAYGQLVELETVPPQTKEQQNLVAGKLATFGFMAEATPPKPARKTGPTDPKKIETDKPKS